MIAHTLSLTKHTLSLSHDTHTHSLSGTVYACATRTTRRRTRRRGKCGRVYAGSFRVGFVMVVVVVVFQMVVPKMCGEEKVIPKVTCKCTCGKSEGTRIELYDIFLFFLDTKFWIPKVT